MIRVNNWFVPVGLAAALLAGCGGGSDGPQATGLRGVVVNGPPDTTVQRRAGATVVVYGKPNDPSIEEEVARTTSNERGEFFIQVPPGQYGLDIVPDHDPQTGLCSTYRSGSVSQGQVTNVVLGYDSCGVPTN